MLRKPYIKYPFDSLKTYTKISSGYKLLYFRKYTCRAPITDNKCASEVVQ